MTEFERIYREHFNTVYGFLMRLCRSAPLSEELAQETFFRAMRSLNRFDGRCRIEVWLCQIAKNAYYSHCRRRKDREHTLPEADSGLRVEDAILDKAQAMAIHERLHSLPEPYKEVFMLRVFGELDYAQIAKLFSKTESWARVTYHRAKMKLTEAIKEDEDK
ncbi:MAG: sigma-70 family RNA polymerase sigma factor [Clostridia bacterium]|nr:sigma-70 family RNA polymerase sigma factor [Clostridia bacterium]